MAAADRGNVSIPFWDFIKKNLDDEGQRKILLQKDKSGRSSLHYAMASWGEGADVVLNIYKETFGEENLIKLIRDEDLDGQNALAYAIEHSDSFGGYRTSLEFFARIIFQMKC